VPKGPSYDPTVKRLAVHVEDHPLDYRTFEGTIPRGEYGAGAVIVWDAGTYRNLTERRGRPVPMRDAIDNGHVSIWLDGQKLHGGWSLTRTGGTYGGGTPADDNWLMIKRRDDFANPELDITSEAPASVQSGRDLDAVAGDPEAATWTGSRATWDPPMLATLVDPDEFLARSGPGWVYERKLDGLRCLAVRNGDQVELWSRNHNSFTARFPTVAAALARVAAPNFTVDGELVAFDGKDFVGFGDLQQHGSALAVVYCVFDLLQLLGKDTRELPLGDRKRLLAQAVASGDDVQVVEELDGDPATLLARACRQGWEGLIAKRADSTYAAGRSPDWRKLKCSASQELVIGGYTEPRGQRRGFGALLVGYFDGDTLRYAGKVGTGFSDKTLHHLHGEMAKRRRDTAPFADPPREKTAHWVEPELVANIAFSEWTRDGKLRHPRFEGLRTDKPARAVVRERPQTPR
jgi:bifunctional non-homologous end joining protein LigD